MLSTLYKLNFTIFVLPKPSGLFQFEPLPELAVSAFSFLLIPPIRLELQLLAFALHKYNHSLGSTPRLRLSAIHLSVLGKKSKCILHRLQFIVGQSGLASLHIVELPAIHTAFSFEPFGIERDESRL